MGKLVFDLCMHFAFLLSLYLLPRIPGIIQGLLMSISPITTFLLWLQNKRQKSGREFKRGINVERLILKVGDGKLGNICEEEPFTNSEFESDEDKKVEMMGDAIRQKENVVKVCEKVGESGKDLCHQKVGKVNECAKGHKVRLLIAEFEKKLGSIQWNNNGKSKAALSTLPDEFVCSSENNNTPVEESHLE
ncbi:unnamed protein product [Hymenolepis diminuta]|uniref:Uncharacterized protein n=1 Tax=Hymenolepis diminuta TaxID=6216 RepID=A0A564XZF3_HYMDI|nr:unnamed protein product [Hymenolepis diminuta]